MADPKGLYAALEVPPTASSDELKKSYRKLALRWHPDKNPEDETATARFQQLSNAYAVLSDEQQRAIYDRTGRVGDEPDEGCEGFGFPFGGGAADIEEMMEMFASMFEGAGFGDDLDREVELLLQGDRRQ